VVPNETSVVGPARSTNPRVTRRPANRSGSDSCGITHLRELYAEIHRFAAEHDSGDTPLAPRDVVQRSLDADLILLVQGLAQGTQRVTVYPYRTPGGLSQAAEAADEAAPAGAQIFVETGCGSRHTPPTPIERLARTSTRRQRVRGRRGSAMRSRPPDDFESQLSGREPKTLASFVAAEAGSP
jgi:hypothetical protein